MKKQKQTLPVKTATQTPSDDPNLGTAILAIGGFILFAAVIFTLVISGHL